MRLKTKATESSENWREVGSQVKSNISSGGYVANMENPSTYTISASACEIF